MTYLAIILALAIWLCPVAALWWLASNCQQTDLVTRLGILGWPVVIVAVIVWVLLALVLETIHAIAGRLLDRCGL